MATNGTTTSDSATLASQHQASGRSIFWAMASIALNAMLQPSFTGYLWSGDTFKDSLWPHRSSPFVCLMDAAADIWIMIEKVRKPELYGEDEERIQPTTLTMRLAIFVVGVLPQIIKLFSSTGIPITQAVAAVFVFATMTSMIRASCSAAPMSDIVYLAERALKKKAPEDMSSHDRDLPSFGEIICSAATTPHVLVLVCIWEHIFKITHIHSSSADINNLLQWASILASITCATYALQHTACVLATGKWYLPRSGPLFVFGLYTPVMLSKLLEHPDSSRRQMNGERINYWVQILSFLFHAAALSYVVALVLELLAKWLLRSSTKQKSNDDAVPMSELTGFSAEPSAGTTPADDSTTINVNTPTETVSGTSPGSEIPTSTSVQSDNPPLEDGTLRTETHVQESAEPAAAAVGAPTITPPLHAEKKRPSVFAEAFGDFLCFVAIIPLGFVIFVSAYIGTFHGAESDSADDDAAERGEASQQQSETSNESASPDAREPWSLMSFLVTIAIQPVVLLFKLPGQDKVVRPVVKFISYGIWRIVIAGMSMYGFAFNWVAAKIRANIRNRVCVAFGILNVMTAMITYLALFDTQGTYSPSWTTLLGK
ncbi:hypothetical protein LTR78_001931 [Recurvomyces mirabilis]|uniref:Uncharacterized protein n=1 Tax=Recurvomyces mirabilis TaxID=574656 RepID=A0AAE1C5A3_9PEZI|nr:hypothetical protein LTR78_001931 [Recurvomyces mirabilis]KAK5156630.1 hypothetical protein LTS14_004842 [Recurvomyces mirabilis]